MSEMDYLDPMNMPELLRPCAPGLVYRSRFFLNSKWSGGSSSTGLNVSNMMARSTLCLLSVSITSLLLFLNDLTFWKKMVKSEPSSGSDSNWLTVDWLGSFWALLSRV